MKQTSRKKVLLSSVAMMMVATVSLGSATFAWFSQNTKATASGITAQTSQSSNIVLSETGGDDWTDKLVFKNYAKSSMTPVTTADFDTWYTTTADTKDAGVKGADNEYSDDVTANTDYTSTKLYMKYETSEGNATQKVKITLNVTDNSANSSSTEDFLRVALVPVDNATKTVFGTTNLVWGTAADDFALDKDAFVYDSEGNLASNANKTITSKPGEKLLVSEATLAANTAYQFNVYVWYEGTDPQCIDSKAVNDLSISFDVAKA